MLAILNFNAFLQSPDSPAAKKFCHELTKTCHETGFFYLTGHGIEPAQNDDVTAMAQGFFALPEEDRRAIAIGKSPHFRGYTILGDERTQGKSDWRDQIDIGPEAKALDMDEHDPAWLRLIGPNQWPVKIPEMPGIVANWAESMNHVSMELFRALAIGLGQPYHYFDALMTPNPYFMNPRLGAVFAPIPLPADLAAGTNGGQNTDPNDSIYAVFGENTLKIRMRSHPDVVAAHYPEMISFVNKPI